MTANIIEINAYRKKRNKNNDDNIGVINNKKACFSKNDMEIFKSILDKASKLGW